MLFAKKSLGQNFLMHPQTAERIVLAAALPEGATVLEIGPGTGMLTRALLARAEKVIAVEADDALAPELMETFAEEIAAGKLEIIHQDIRTFDTKTLPASYHVVANIPYYITGELMRQFLTAVHKPETMTILVQKEVAERIARSKGKESVLSISVKVYGEPEYCFTVPSVDSAVLSIRHISNTSFPSAAAETLFFTLLKAGFAHKRKRLAKNLEVVADPARITSAITAAGLTPNTRPEEVTVAQWRTLAQELG
jgi:16S rRNA (adenine1518-N6/adenine1519-N6)-dimethyltransferase